MHHLTIQQAVRANDHKAICDIAKRSKYTSSFSSIMFSSDAAYDKGWIRVAVDKESGEILGFSCVRHKTRSPETILYFIGVDPDKSGQGIGQALMLDLESETPHKRICLKVMKDNPRAIRFYEQLGYDHHGPAYKGEGVEMYKDIIG